MDTEETNAETEVETDPAAEEEDSSSILLKRKAELSQEILVIEDAIALAVENDKFDEAAELDEE
eukprot:CAMPEP_0118661628 /NCGR_PEP_ID=MMETSP0785-20121206/16391_1 /TAXON_ID=91992 /ORGANISM="Bolidomonas pacifica, Strain CCMP 1866" /LENGTH=63 /DNA_ID=CAMNT_0006555101 /DNA_START=47 /DNA_END=235 /DNA_ORIENTATION=+